MIIVTKEKRPVKLIQGHMFWAYLHSIFCGGLRKTHECILKQSVFKPFKVIQGRSFWYQIKGAYATSY